MMQEALLDTTQDVKQGIYRNIVSLRKSEHLFDDLADDEESLNIAIAAEMRIKQHVPAGIIQRGFHYSTAIAYPFENEPHLASRYSDGSFGIWYGSLELETTVYETAYHMVKTESGISGLTEPIIRERAIYHVHCHAILLDIRHKVVTYPDLVADDYDFTQQLGRRIAREGHPGLLAPSARCEGHNAIIFNPQVLSNPHIACYLQYTFNPLTREVLVERQPGKLWLQIRHPA